MKALIACLFVQVVFLLQYLRADNLDQSVAYSFKTVAGAGRGHRDGPGNQALFGAPEGIAVDNDGIVYFTEYNTTIVRKMTPEGFVTTMAGQSKVTGSRDGMGTESLFNRPHGAAVDADRNIFIADMKNNTIRRIARNGLVSTLAGVVEEQGSHDGPSQQATFFWPEGVAVDKHGTVYVADTYNYTVRAISRDGIVRTIAGKAGDAGYRDGPGDLARFNRPMGLAVDGQGCLYVVDANYDDPATGNGLVRKIAPDGIVSTLAGSVGEVGASDGKGDNARFHKSVGIAVTSEGVVFVADTEADTIRRILPDGTVSTIGGAYLQESHVDGIGDAARFHDPQAIAVDKSGNLYVADTFNYCIRKGTPTKTERLPMDNQSISKDWEWVRPAKNGFHFIDGKLKIRSLPGNVFADSEAKLGPTQNILKRRLPNGDWQATLSASHRPKNPGQQMGVYLYVDEANHFKIIHEFLKPLNGPGLVSVLEIDNQPSLSELIPSDHESIELRLERFGSKCRASYRTPNQSSFQTLKDIELLSSFTEASIAIVVSGAPIEANAWGTIEKFDLSYPLSIFR
jgi:sugar lactone lactonase YvrE